MEVKDHHNYAVAGGLIIHNCIDAARYACESEMQGRLGFAQTAGPGGRTDRIYVR